MSLRYHQSMSGIRKHQIIQVMYLDATDVHLCNYQAVGSFNWGQGRHPLMTSASHHHNINVINVSHALSSKRVVLSSSLSDTGS